MGPDAVKRADKLHNIAPDLCALCSVAKDGNCVNAALATILPIGHHNAALANTLYKGAKLCCPLLLTYSCALFIFLSRKISQQYQG